MIPALVREVMKAKTMKAKCNDDEVYKGQSESNIGGELLERFAVSCYYIKVVDEREKLIIYSQQGIRKEFIRELTRSVKVLQTDLGDTLSNDDISRMGRPKAVLQVGAATL